MSLPPGPHRLSARIGICPEAYTKRRTDGVSFVLRLEREGMPAQTVFERFLDPRRVAADRGDQALAVDVDSTSGGTLVLTTGSGPDQDDRWDWAYLAALRLDAPL